MNFVNLLAIDFSTILMLAILLFLVVLMVLGYMKRRKFNTQLQSVRDNIKVGDKVMTDTGVVGEIAEIVTEGEHKYFVVKSGTAKNFGFVKVHANAVYYVFDNEKPKYATTEADDDDVDADEVDAKDVE
ncbi:MAG: preprotein translocase subunit YajC [Clostridia bacterium]